MPPPWATYGYMARKSSAYLSASISVASHQQYFCRNLWVFGDMTESLTTGERLRSRRRALNISAEDLGRRAAMIMGRSKPISASAVRNQENGTNGLPMAVAEAYAEVLKTDAQWLLFGDRELSPDQEERELWKQAIAHADHEDNLSIEDITIGSYGIISGRWLPAMVRSDSANTDDDICLLIPGWTQSGVPMSAYEVADTSLEPVFHKGSWLIAAPQGEAVLNDGTIVIAAKHRGEDLHQSVRMLKATKDGVDLVGIGAAPQKSEPLVRNDRLVDGVYVTDAIVATVHYLPGGTGRPLDAKTPFAPDYLLPGNEADAESILAKARAILARQEQTANDSETTE